MKTYLIVVVLIKISLCNCYGNVSFIAPKINNFSKDSIRNIDTLVYANDWKKMNYLKISNKKGFVEKKRILYKSDTIDLEQSFCEKKNKYYSHTLIFNGKDYNIRSIYKRKYNTRFNNQFYFMGNLVTAKHFKDYISIDLIIVENNCLGEFCNDVTILTLQIDLSGKLTCIFHDEDLTNYSL
jgi:hypothetical protein